MNKKELHEYFKEMGKRGGKARLKRMTDEERKAVAKKAAQARWNKAKKGPQK